MVNDIFCKPHIPSELQPVYRLIETELEEVENLICKDFSSHDPFVEEVIRYGLGFAGKRLRPMLLLLSGKVFGPLHLDHLRFAAVLEVIHTATLLHDDILDGAKLRRHLETINIRWNNATSILAGDMMLAQAMRILTQSENLFAYRTVTDATWKTCEAELRQIGAKRCFTLPKQEYLAIISGKTATLLSCCCLLGAYFGGAEESVRRVFADFGEKIGIAFQITDDILDLIGTEQTTGKTLGTDLIEKKLTLPLLLFLESTEANNRDAMLQLLSSVEMTPEAIENVAVQLKQSGAVESASRYATELIESAIRSLESLKIENADKQAVYALIDVARFVIQRNQ